MRLIVERDPATDITRTTVEITPSDYLNLRLNDFDRQLLRQCDQSEKASDKLLGLELLARRIEEAQQPNGEE